jgi:transposase
MFARTPAKLKTAMADILENAEADLTPRMRNLIDGLWSEWKLVERQIEELNDELERISAADAGCTRIRKIPGIGLVVATAIGKGLRSARGESSQRGLVSSHASTRLVATRGCLASRFCNATKPRQDRKARKFASAQSSISA